jgi:hypothetical protein
MYLLKILAVLVASAGLIVGIHRRLARGNCSRAWHVCFFVFACAGVALGLYFLGVLRMFPPNGRGWGVPFVIAGGDFIEGRWHDGGVGRFQPLALLADLGCGIALGLLPLATASILFGGRGRTKEPKYQGKD